MSKLKLRHRLKKQAHEFTEMFQPRRRPSVAFADYDIDSPSTSISATCILLYGTAHVLCGTVLTLSDALAAKKGTTSLLDHSYYLEVYLMLEYLFAMIGIFVLQVLVMLDERHYKRKCNKSLENEKKLDANGLTPLPSTEPRSRKMSIERFLSTITGASAAIERKFLKRHDPDSAPLRSPEDSMSPMFPGTSPNNIYAPNPLSPPAPITSPPSTFRRNSPPSLLPQIHVQEPAIIESLLSDSVNFEASGGVVRPRLDHMNEVREKKHSSSGSSSGRNRKSGILNWNPEQGNEAQASSSSTTSPTKMTDSEDTPVISLTSNSSHISPHVIFVPARDATPPLPNRSNLHLNFSPPPDGPELVPTVSTFTPPNPPPSIKVDEDKSIYSINYLVPNIKPGEEPGRRVYRDREGVNLYLRLGAVAFGFGVMIHDGFKISDQINESTTDGCRSKLWVPKFVIHLAYIFLQTYFIFKHHRMAFNWHCTLVRLILIHLATVNVVQWLKTIVFEISEEMRRDNHNSSDTHLAYSKNAYQIAKGVHDSMYHKNKSVGIVSIFQTFTNSSLPTAHSPLTQPSSHDTHCSGLADKLSSFLFPCAIEYSLIAAAVCYKLFQKVGIPQPADIHTATPTPVVTPSTPTVTSAHYLNIRHPQPHSNYNSLDRSPMNGNVESIGKTNQTYSECHRSHRGLFVGLLVVMVTMVAMGLFFFLQSAEQGKRGTEAALAITIYQMTEIMLQTITGFACLFALYKMRVLGFRPLTEGEAFDDNLLLVGLCGTVTYNLFLLLPALEHFNDSFLTAKLYILKSILEIVQVLLQMFFIVEASRKCARNAHDVRKKPGRSWVTFLLASNLAMWIVNTFEVKRADEYHEMPREYYRELSWNIINFISLPLIIFFRFHSTVCLSDIWVKCYKMH